MKIMYDPRGAVWTDSPKLPSLLMLSGMRWIFCSLTQLLVNICSSTEVSEAVFTPEDKTAKCQKRLGMKTTVLSQKTYISSAAPWSCPAILHVHNRMKSGNSNSEHKTGMLIKGRTAGFIQDPIMGLSNQQFLCVNQWLRRQEEHRRTFNHYTVIYHTLEVAVQWLTSARPPWSAVPLGPRLPKNVFRIHSQTIPVVQTTMYQEQSQAVLHIPSK